MQECVIPCSHYSEDYPRLLDLIKGFYAWVA